jgi:site-specific DNA recombinase
MTAPAPLRAAAYIRVSDDAQDKDGTPETQRLRIVEYAKNRSTELERSIEIVRWYQDVYTGGDSYYDPNRRDFEALKLAMRRGDFDLILAYKDDRIARGTEIVSFCQECQHFETMVETALDGPLTTNTMIERLILFMRGGGSEEELKKIRSRASDGMAKRAHQQKRVPGCRPRYGYMYDDDRAKAKNRLVADPHTAPIVERIFREYASGRSLRAIGVGLQADGIPTPTLYANRKNPSLMWSFGTIQNIVRDPIYRGEAVALKHRNEHGKTDGKNWTRPKLRPEHERVTLPVGTVPALVEDDVFAIAQERLAVNRALSVRNNPDPDATILRSGLALCDYCGHPLVTRNAPRNSCRVYECSSNTRRRYGCPHFTISAHILDDFVWSKLSAALRDTETIRDELDRQMDADFDIAGKDDLAAIDRELGEIDRRLNGLARDVAKLAGSEYATAALLREMEMQDKHRSTIVANRADIVARQSQRLEDWASWERWADMMRDAQDEIDGYGPAERRDAMIRFGVQARVRREGDGTRIAVTAKIDLDHFAVPYQARHPIYIQRVTPETYVSERQPSEIVYDPKADPFAANERDVQLTTARRSAPS